MAWLPSQLELVQLIPDRHVEMGSLVALPIGDRILEVVVVDPPASSATLSRHWSRVTNARQP